MTLLAILTRTKRTSYPGATWKLPLLMERNARSARALGCHTSPPSSKAALDRRSFQTLDLAESLAGTHDCYSYPILPLHLRERTGTFIFICSLSFLHPLRSNRQLHCFFLYLLNLLRRLSLVLSLQVSSHLHHLSVLSSALVVQFFSSLLEELQISSKLLREAMNDPCTLGQIPCCAPWMAYYFLARLLSLALTDRLIAHCP